MQPDRGLAGAGRALDAHRLSSGARTKVSWSGAMVATMSRIGPTRGRSISAVRMRLVGRVVFLARGEPLVLERG